MTSSEMHHESAAESTNLEYELAFYFCMFLVLLMIAIIVSNHVSHKLHLTFLPEAGGELRASFSLLHDPTLTLSCLYSDDRCWRDRESALLPQVGLDLDVAHGF